MNNMDERLIAEVYGKGALDAIKSHDALVEALEPFVEMLKTLRAGKGLGMPCREDLERAEAALKLAKGEA